MKKVFILIAVLMAVNIWAQSFPRQTDGRDSTDIPTYYDKRWGTVNVIRGDDDKWHVLRGDSSGYLTMRDIPFSTIYSSLDSTGTTVPDTIVFGATCQYVNIAIKESVGYYIGFNLEPTIYVPPGCTFSLNYNVDSVFVILEEDTSLVTVIGGVY
jgi:hypothetical protein